MFCFIIDKLVKLLQKGLRPFSSKVFAKPLSCPHFGQVFVNIFVKFLFLSMTQDMVMPIFFFSEVLRPRCLLLRFQNFPGNFGDLQHLPRILSAMLLSNTMMKVMKTEKNKFRLRKLNIILMPMLSI